MRPHRKLNTFGRDQRSLRSVFLAHCLLAQCVRANGLAKYYRGPVTPVIEFCLEHEINMIQLPCPETLFSNNGIGLPREPHGKAHYEKLGFRDHCRDIASEQAQYIEQIANVGVNILGIIGIDFSPACAVNYINRGRKIIREQGIFVEELKSELLRRKISLPFIGVNQRAHKKMQMDLLGMLEPRKEE